MDLLSSKSNLEYSVGVLWFCKEHVECVENLYKDNLTVSFLARELRLYQDRSAGRVAADGPFVAPLVRLFQDVAEGDWAFSMEGVRGHRHVVMSLLYLKDENLLPALAAYTSGDIMRPEVRCLTLSMNSVEKLVRRRLSELTELAKDGLIPDEDRQKREEALQAVCDEVVALRRLVWEVKFAKQNLERTDEAVSSKIEKLQSGYERGLITRENYEQQMQRIESERETRTEKLLGDITDDLPTTKEGVTPQVAKDAKVFFTCKGCGASLRTNVSNQGKSVRCPRCKGACSVPVTAEKEDFGECPNGHGRLDEWQGRPRCWKCGWTSNGK
jgi:predicted Zn-ribbon and HTH transcriptional regulator